MAFNLIETIRGYLTPDLIDNASSQFGEAPTGINKAITAAVPALLALFVSRTERGDAQGLLNDSIEASNSNVLSHPQGLLSGGMGSFPSSGIIDRVRGIGGGGFDNIISSIAGYAGIKNGSVQGILGLLAPLSLGVLGNHAKQNNLSANGLASFLSNQKSSIMSALPAGFTLGSLSGGRTETVAEPRTTQYESDTRRQEAVREEKKTNWVPWVLLALGAIALIWFLTRDREPEQASTTVSTDTNTVISTTPTDNSATTTTVPVTTDTTARQSTKVRLANNVEIDAYRGGVEDQLVACLNDAGCAAGNDKWFDFDNINFETGSARLTAESQAQVKNIVAVLNAYPKAVIKIGGYTDKTGDELSNKKLSQQRADAVLGAIKEAGAKASQLAGAEGYGSQFAKVPATASDEERRPDRRISVQLRAK